MSYGLKNMAYIQKPTSADSLHQSYKNSTLRHFSITETTPTNPTQA